MATNSQIVMAVGENCEISLFLFQLPLTAIILMARENCFCKLNEKCAHIDDRSPRLDLKDFCRGLWLDPVVYLKAVQSISGYSKKSSQGKCISG